MSKDSNTKSMSMIVTKGTLDWAYPPFILATTAAAMGIDVTMFFTFYGLGLLKKKLNLKVSPLGNAAMEMPMLGMHIGMPNMVAAHTRRRCGGDRHDEKPDQEKRRGFDRRAAHDGRGSRRQDDRLPNDHGSLRIQARGHDRGAGPGRGRHLHRERHQVRHQLVHLERRKMADQLLDAKGLNCPLPILRAKKALKDVAMGGTLEVLATDPGAVKDFEAFCRATGNELVASNVDGKVYSFVIKRLS